MKIKTGNDGVARFELPAGAAYLVASQGADRALLPRSINSWDEEPWAANPPQNMLRWYVFDDRQMYRPGEEVHFKGWLRQIGGRQDGDVGLAGSDLRSVEYQIIDPQGNAIGNGQADVNALGGFDFAFTIPQSANLGNAQLILRASGSLDGLGGLDYSPLVPDPGVPPPRI